MAPGSSRTAPLIGIISTSPIGVARAGKMRVGKAENGGIDVLVAAGPGIAFLEIARLRVRAELHHAEGHDGAGKQVAGAGRADQGIDRSEGIRMRCR